MKENSQLEGLSERILAGWPVFNERMQNIDLTRSIVIRMHDKLFVEGVTSPTYEQFVSGVTQAANELVLAYSREILNKEWSDLTSEHRQKVISIMIDAMFYWVVANVIAQEVTAEQDKENRLENILQQFGGKSEQA